MKPLTGIRVVEIAALGPLEHAGMMLADLGAEVIRIVRTPSIGPTNPIHRGRTTRVLNLKEPADLEQALALIASSDVLLEGMRPGAMERLGLGPDEIARHNPGIVYGRMTGWGQTGPLAPRAGHDINYIAETGALASIVGAEGRPAVPLNLIGDFGGGALYLVVGVLASLLQRDRSGVVIDAAIVDGVSSLLQCVRGLAAVGEWTEQTGGNLLDGGRPWYDVYRCLDGKYMAVGALEPQFYEQLLHGLGLAPTQMPDRDDPENWPVIRNRLTEAFARRTRDEWAEILGALDACATPVLSLREAEESPHLLARGSLQSTAEGPSTAPAPRLSRLTPTPVTDSTEHAPS